jgi:hypothetical protein
MNAVHSSIVNASRPRLAALLRRALWTIAAAGFLGGLMTACEPRPTSLTVPLAYTPQETASVAFTLPPGAGKIYLMQVDDARQDKSRIGENNRQPTVVPISVATRSVADWVHDTTLDLFRTNGINVVDNADDADLLVSITLTSFWARESPDYTAKVMEVVKVQDKSDRAVWTGAVSGDATGSDSELKVKAYQQVLSDALDSATLRLLANPEFEKALVPKAAGSETVKPPGN